MGSSLLAQPLDLLSRHLCIWMGWLQTRPPQNARANHLVAAGSGPLLSLSPKSKNALNDGTRGPGISLLAKDRRRLLAVGQIHEQR